MTQKIIKTIMCISVVFGLAMSASAKDFGGVDVSGGERTSLLGSPEGWVSGPATGLPHLVGWRIERFWPKNNDELPLWLAGADVGILYPGARVSVERRLWKSPFYAGLGGRVLYIPLMGWENAPRILSLSIPISYRSGTGWKNRAVHVSVSAEVVTRDFDEWYVYWPALHIAFLSRL